MHAWSWSSSDEKIQKLPKIMFFMRAGSSGNVRKKPLSDTSSNTEYSALVFSGNKYKQASSNDDDHAGPEENVKCLHPGNGLCKSATRR